MSATDDLSEDYPILTFDGVTDDALLTDYDPDNVTCKNCGKSGLKWSIDKDSQKYKLMENRLKKHICEQFGGSGFSKKKFTKIVRYKKKKDDSII